MDFTSRSASSLPAKASRRVDLPAPGGPSSKVILACSNKQAIEIFQKTWCQIICCHTCAARFHCASSMIIRKLQESSKQSSNKISILHQFHKHCRVPRRKLELHGEHQTQSFGNSPSRSNNTTDSMQNRELSLLLWQKLQFCQETLQHGQKKCFQFLFLKNT